MSDELIDGGGPLVEIARLREAIGLATTLKPTMIIRPDDPVGMMQEVVAWVSEGLGE